MRFHAFSIHGAWVAACLALLPVGAMAQTQVPAVINYQGRLTDALGNAVAAGYYVVDFRIWDDPAKTGAGNYVWGQQYPIHVVTGGIFNVLLSDAGGVLSTPGQPRTNKLQYAFGGPVRYLGLTVVQTPAGNVASPVEIVPRQQLASAPFALQTQVANQVIDGAVGNSSLADGVVTVAKLGTGAVTVDKLGSGAVTTDKLANLAVVSGKLATGAVTTVQLGDASVVTSKIATGAVTSNSLAAGAVNTVALGAGAVTAAKLNVDGDIGLNDHLLHLRGSGDANYSLGWISGTDGPNLVGNQGGRLATKSGSSSQSGDARLSWDLNGVAVTRLRANQTKTPTNYSILGPLVVGSDASDNHGSPANGLYFVNNTGDSHGFGHAAIYADGWANYNGNLVFATDGDDESNFNPTEKMRLTAFGRLGIGTASPGAQLHVTGPRLAYNGTDGIYMYYGFDDDSNVKGTTTAQNTVALFEGDVVTSYSMISLQSPTASDERAKRVLGRSSGAADLATLDQIEITDFTWIDTRGVGSRPQKKVVAQQVEQVLPNAVSQIEKCVPDIYSAATSLRRDAAAGKLELTVPKVHGLVAGDEVDVYANTGEFRRSRVLEVGSPTTFTIACPTAPTNAFVYGKWVKDFRVVDYDAIAMLNVSATQELARQVADKDAAIRELRRELDQLAAQVRELAAVRPASTNVAASASVPAPSLP